MRKSTVLAGTIALIAGVLTPTGFAAAQEPAATAAAADSTRSDSTKAVPESPTGSYIVVLKQDPLVTTIATDQLTTPDATARAADLTSTHDQVLAEVGADAGTKINDYTNALNGFSAVVSHDQAVALAANSKVATVLPDELRQVTGESSTAAQDSSFWNNPGTAQDELGSFLGLTGRGEAWRSGINGEGVVVGVIDTGIWPEHPSFADDGSFPAAPVLENTPDLPSCDFGNTAANANDAPFTCTNKLVGARQMMDTFRSQNPDLEPFEFDSARDEDGHGTHTASTAAGNAGVQAEIFDRKIAKISGIAPRAQVIAYKALGPGGGYTSDLVSAIDQAVADGVDVINYSIGGGAQLVSGDTIAFLFAADAGVFSAVSAGNDGPGASTIGGPADVPWVTTVGANTMTRSFEGTIKLEGGPTLTGTSVTLGTIKYPLMDAAAAGNELCLTGSLDPAKVTGAIVLCKRGTNGRIEKSYAVQQAGGVGMILYNATDADDLFTDNFFVPTVMIDNTTGLKVKQYLASRPNPKADLDTGKVGVLRAAPSMTLFSSRGPNPTAADIIKPDITAPGIQILAGATPAPDPTVEPTGQLFQAIAGTSMSSPVVAGVYALIKQAHPEWSAAAAKSAIMTTANTRVKDNDKRTQAGPFAMGSGMVDPGRVNQRGSAFDPGIVYEAGINEYLGFLCDTGPEAFVDPDATCASLEAAGIPTEASDLNIASVGVSALAGSQTVTRTITSVADRTVTWRSSVSAPPGYRVSVKPSQITLAPGGSASYQLTITNRNATLQEWSTGAVTWTGGPTRGRNSATAEVADSFAERFGGGHGHGYGSGRYQVRSPIAVYGLPLAAPAEVSGTGTAGTASFPVTFGYTGAYTAAPHGLEAATVTNGTIDQDPDQTYPSADDGTGVVAVPVQITGALHARWSLVLPGDDDLDLYLLDPAGEIIAISGNGGTDEQIDIDAPADGQYTLVVHGWAVGQPDLPFTLNNWIVPTTAGSGTLQVTSAPSTATGGATGTVNLSWSGLTAGTAYLGAVSHSDASGVIGTTLVDVTG